jgi:hypothetical protein
MHHAVCEAMKPQDVMTGGRVRRDGEGGFTHGGVILFRTLPLTVSQLLPVLPLRLRQLCYQNHPGMRVVSNWAYNLRKVHFCVERTGFVHQIERCAWRKQISAGNAAA